jgi:hypothetical protein
MWDPNISQPYRPPRPVMGVALLHLYITYIYSKRCKWKVTFDFVHSTVCCLGFWLPGTCTMCTVLKEHNIFQTDSVFVVWWNMVSSHLAWNRHKKRANSVALVRERTIPTQRPPLIGEVSANVCGHTISCGQHNGSLRPYSRFSRIVTMT